MRKSTILTNFCNLEILRSRCRQSWDSGLAKTTGIPELQSLVSWPVSGHVSLSLCQSVCLSVHRDISAVGLGWYRRLSSWRESCYNVEFQSLHNGFASTSTSAIHWRCQDTPPHFCTGEMTLDYCTEVQIITRSLAVAREGQLCCICLKAFLSFACKLVCTAWFNFPALCYKVV